MNLNLSSLSFNLNIEGGGGTPAWGTELGQGAEYKFSDNLQDFLTAMLYKSVSNINDVKCPLGKGGHQEGGYDFIVASIFDKVFVNGVRIQGARMLLLIVRKIEGNFHVGRMSLKYNPKMTYQGKFINEDCYRLISIHLGLEANNGAWFAGKMYTLHQDELHLTVYIGDTKPLIFSNSAERKRFYLEKMKDTLSSKSEVRKEQEEFLPSHQIIYYGAPGTGKSYKIKEYLESQQVSKENIFRTTFHPDSDYATFVGTYKPTMVEQYRYTDNGTKVKYTEDDNLACAQKSDPIIDKSIEYSFVPQVFLNAYIRAYQTQENVYLVIEEINRGNCAQIFGDLFQLLDRNAEGKSDYTIKADTDLRAYLENILGSDNEGIKDGELCLPSNIYIFATMNTSDQSLFPIDSAFKRRWDWEYEPIKYKNQDWSIIVGSKQYSWVSFQKIVNERIFDSIHSEDKMLGDYFVNPHNGIITEQILLNKVLFYLWNDVCKEGEGEIFKTSETEEVSFSDLYGQEGQQRIIQMMEYLGVNPFSTEENKNISFTDSNIVPENEEKE